MKVVPSAEAEGLEPEEGLHRPVHDLVALARGVWQPKPTGNLRHPGTVGSDHGDAVARFLKRVCAGEADHSGADNGHKRFSNHRGLSSGFVAYVRESFPAGAGSEWAWISVRSSASSAWRVRSTWRARNDPN